MDLSLDDGTLDPGDVVFTGVTGLERSDGPPFPAAAIDPEGIALSGEGTIFISSEGDANALIDPFVAEFTRDGRLLDDLPVPGTFLPTADSSSGIRNNLAFESLTLTPAGDTLITATAATAQR